MPPPSPSLRSLRRHDLRCWGLVYGQRSTRWGNEQMTDRPIPPDRRRDGQRRYPGGPTQRGYVPNSADMTSRADASEFATGQSDALAWSQAAPEAAAHPLQYPPSYVAPTGPNDGDNAPAPPNPWYRGTAVYLFAAAAFAVALAGGGLAYTLTGATQITGPPAPSNPNTAVRETAPNGTPDGDATRTPTGGSTGAPSGGNTSGGSRTGGGTGGQTGTPGGGNTSGGSRTGGGGGATDPGIIPRPNIVDRVPGTTGTGTGTTGIGTGTAQAPEPRAPEPARARDRYGRGHRNRIQAQVQVRPRAPATRYRHGYRYGSGHRNGYRHRHRNRHHRHRNGHGHGHRHRHHGHRYRNGHEYGYGDRNGNRHGYRHRNHGHRCGTGTGTGTGTTGTGTGTGLTPAQKRCIEEGNKNC